MIEFEGFVSHDFDFFKKKDKFTKEEYNTIRNGLKQSFRSMCYEIQKLYHSNTDGFYEIDKEFQNFGKKGMEIIAQHVMEDNKYKIVYELNADNISIGLHFPSQTDDIEKSIETIKNKKSTLIDLIMQSKNMQMSAQVNRNSKDNTIIRLHGFEASNKNFDAFINSIETAKKDGKNISNISIKYVYSKNECIRLGKSFTVTSYNCTMKLYKLYSSK